MNEQSPSDSNSRRAEVFGLLSVSGTLAGLCITVAAFMNSTGKARGPETIADDVFAACSAAFLLCIYLIFGALKTRNAGFSTALIRAADLLFLLALTTMTTAAFLMVYTIL